MKLSLPVVITGFLSLSSLLAEDITHIAKAQFLVQTSAAAPTVAASDGYGFESLLVLAVPGFETITSPQLKLPSGSSKPLPINADGNGFTIGATYDSQSALEADYPAGNYAFTGTDSIFGAFNASLTLPATAFPTAPQIVNFTDAQAVDVTKDFDLKWGAFAGAVQDQDLASLVIEDDQGNTFLNIDAGSLDVTETSTTIYADSLTPGKTYHGTLSFIKVVGATLTAFPFPKAAFASETRFTLVAQGGGGGGNDTTPPTLTQSLPDTGSTFASQYQGVVFIFSEAMNQSKIGVAWSATLNGQPYTLDPAKFTTIWDGEGKTLVVNYGVTSGGWPNGLALSWNLRPDPNAANAFRDLAGNVVDTNYSGSFYTVGGSPGCPGEDFVESASFGVFKRVEHLQTGPGPATGTPAGGGNTFFAFFGKAGQSTTLNPSVTLEFPAPPAPLPHKLDAFEQVAIGVSTLTQSFATAAELDATFPATTYALQLRNFQNPVDQQVTSSVVFDLGAGGYPATPHFANFAAAQAVDATADFTLPWDAFAGANAGSAISLSIEDADGKQVFSAPDTCGGMPLTNSAVSITIPKGTLKAAMTYTATLTFNQVSEHDKTMPNVAGKGVAAVASATQMTLKTIGGVTATAPVVRSITAAGTGQFTLVLDCTVGAPITFQTTTALDAPFSVNLLTTNPPVTPFSVTLPISASAQGFLRAVVN
ncbi:MAG TPA: hypothetical protein VMB21_17110 [Candidatus Limnocylindria bacterium]|nr:hypothetical protein [Candidatus Limnocylindria bacterium]